MIPLLLIISAAVLLFYAIVFQLDIPGSWKFALVFLEMAAVSQLLIKRYKMPSELGLVLVKSKKGIEIIDAMAKKERFFNFISDAGVVTSYGLLSLKMMRKNITLPSAAFGLVALGLLSVFVAPTALSVLLYVAGIGAASKSGGVISGSVEYGFLLVGGLLLAAGLFGLILFGIVFYGIVIFKALVTTLFYGTDAIANTTPGGDILLPGVNLPFFEGVLALAVVLVVHEGAHAILARIAKIPILSSGIVFFGIIPIGAFVEPDERKLAKTEPVRQTRVLVAGPTANLMTSLAFFAIFMVFFFSTSMFREGVLLAASGLPSGTVIYQIAGQSPEDIDFSAFSLPKLENVTLLTNKGEMTLMTDDKGKLGIEFYVLGKDSFLSRYTVPGLQFVHVLLGLILALNFIVGTVNILPVPLFDGYRLIDVNVKNKLVVKVLSYGALFFFILNFLPKLFQ
jgi:hypothetical protein